MMFEQQNATIFEDNGSDAIPVLSAMLSEKLKCKPSHDRIGSTFIMEEIATDVNSDGVVSLRTVRNFLEELIFAVQKSQNKLIVSWDSVCKRFYDMMSSDDCPDEDIALLGRYQLSMPFFQYQLDEKVLEAWTGLDDVVEVFSLPEFEGFECFREVRPPHSLMITVNARLCSPCLEKVSVAVSTEDLVAPLAESPEFGNYAPFLNVDSKLDEATSLDNCGAEDGGDSQQKKCLDSGIEHSAEISDSNSSISSTMPEDTAEQLADLLALIEPAKPSVIAPEPTDLPDPFALFDGTARPSGEAATAVRHFTASKCESKNGPLIELEDDALGARNRAENTQPSSQSEELPSAAQFDPFWESSSPGNEASTANRLENSGAPTGSKSEAEEGDSEVRETSHNLESKATTSRSILVGLDDVLFPDVNDKVIDYLRLIREEVAGQGRNGVSIQLERILAKLHEEISAEWIDYVLYYVPQVTILPMDGQVFVAWGDT
ncbi:unnamed protein product [Nippostrongylus brasiliensis]|uniref:EF-hand domain-containing protein n=1 Tax=Nippostrongylus brasiliensis TaxID=27835 RepID=A0A0N4XT41_NIPBR|nr:unnamed protein product [Nippostrongylus brasiliensis]